MTVICFLQERTLYRSMRQKERKPLQHDEGFTWQLGSLHNKQLEIRPGNGEGTELRRERRGKGRAVMIQTVSHALSTRRAKCGD